MKKMIFLMMVLLLLFIVGCDDAPSGGNNNKCDDKCSTEGVNSCSDDKLMLCAKDKDGCFVLTEVKICANGCKDNVCVEDNKECNPVCEEWQTCSDDSKCKLTNGRCVENSDCSDEKICDDTHKCVEKAVEKKKTKIIIGAGGKSKSASFKLKLNVGKVKSMKEMNSAGYKMKVGAKVE